METIVCLEGSKTPSHISYLKNYFEEEILENHNFIVLDNLYEEQSKLFALKYIDAEFIFIATTGMPIFVYDKSVKVLVLKD